VNICSLKYFLNVIFSLVLLLVFSVNTLRFKSKAPQLVDPEFDVWVNLAHQINRRAHSLAEKIWDDRNLHGAERMDASNFAKVLLKIDKRLNIQNPDPKKIYQLAWEFKPHHDGKISFDEVSVILRNIMVSLAREKFLHNKEFVPEKGTHQHDLEELFDFIVDCFHRVKDIVEKVFQAADVHKTGLVTPTDLVAVLKHKPPHLSPHKIKKILRYGKR